MTNEEAIKHIREEQKDDGVPSCEAIEMAVSALEQIEELKRLCMLASERSRAQMRDAIEVKSFGEQFDNGYLLGRAHGLEAGVKYLNGDPSELRKLAGEE